jgi:hypothetical protein
VKEKAELLAVELGSLTVKGVVPVVSAIVRFVLPLASVVAVAVRPRDFVALATALIAPRAESVVETVRP